MTRDEFEQLLSEWCDRPEDPGLARRVEAAAAADPALAEARDRWVCFERMVRRRLPCMGGVRWEALCRRIGQAVRNRSASEVAQPGGQ